MTSSQGIILVDENGRREPELIVAGMSAHVRKFDYPENLERHLTSIARKSTRACGIGLFPALHKEDCPTNLSASYADLVTITTLLRISGAIQPHTTSMVHCMQFVTNWATENQFCSCVKTYVTID